MAKIPELPCSKVREIRSMLMDGRGNEARTRVVDLLHAGFASQPFLDLVADILQAPKRQAAGQPSRPPRQWLEIGESYEEGEGDGLARKDLIPMLAEKFDCSERTIEQALKIYKTAKEDAAEY